MFNTFNTDALIHHLLIDDGVIGDVLGHVHQACVLSMRHDMVADAWRQDIALAHKTEL
jgi:hypothetical protein